MAENPNETNPDLAAEEALEAILEPSAPEAPPELLGGQPQTPAPEGPGRGRGDEDRLSKALETIAGLQREIADIKGQPRQQVVYQQPPPSGEMPMEMMEVFPGRVIPKDPDKRAIKLKSEDLLRMGWNEDPAMAINTLANAFFHHIAEVVPAITMAYLGEQNTRAVSARTREETFYGEFPDLKDFSDLAQIVEQQALAEGRIQGMSQQEWNREVGGRVRSRIAAMRGVSVDQYTASVGAPRSGAPRSRAVTAPPARSGQRAPANDQQKEMDDLLEGRI